MCTHDQYKTQSTSESDAVRRCRVQSQLWLCQAEAVAAVRCCLILQSSNGNQSSPGKGYVTAPPILPWSTWLKGYVQSLIYLFPTTQILVQLLCPMNDQDRNVAVVVRLSDLRSKRIVPTAPHGVILLHRRYVFHLDRRGPRRKTKRLSERP